MQFCFRDTCTMGDKQKRQSFTLQVKCDIIRELIGGKKQVDVCREKSLSKSTVATIWKNRDELLKAFESINVKVKKMRKSVHDEVDRALLIWFSQQRRNNVTISGAILRTKAEEFGKKVQDNFVCSEGWVERWKARHNICSGKILGEASDVNTEVVDNWISTVWPTIKEEYSENDVFNADETGLFFKLTPDKTLKFRGEKCVGGKLSKERITVLVCANMSGTEKRKLLVIGKSQNPRCFKNVRSLPVDYRANSKAWMTSELFIEHVRKWDEELKRKKRKIVLLIDNCPAHPKIQQLHQWTLKTYYRHSLLIRQVQNIDSGKAVTVSVLDAINLIHKSWQKISRQTIKNCYKHAGFYSPSTDEEYDSDDDLPLHTWLINQQRTTTPGTSTSGNHGVAIEDNVVDEFVTVDDCVITSEFLTDDEIMSAVIEEYEDNNSDTEDEDSTEDATVTNASAVQCLREIRKFLQSRGASQNLFNNLVELETFVDNICANNAEVQKRITDYFNLTTT
ncbi:tigger transposable element-derived protein 4-like [Photinus pyralis]|uniref:tigger transposable element-derived protein 4-like n=1 Tax=Photinus pyralis TaxID=7054 RepID=UPI00126709E5|nr:tigger transposable element-derived protein 4-like [Photinus pyralis]